MTDAFDPDDSLCVGAISGAFGVKGEARIKSFCADPEAIATYGPLYTEDGSRQFTLRLTGAASGVLIGKLSGVDSKEAAEALRGTALHVSRARLPALPDDEFYHADLIGMEVRDPGGALLGQVAAVHNHGAGDLLELTGPRALIIPFTRTVVPTVDLTTRRIVADLPEGLD